MKEKGQVMSKRQSNRLRIEFHARRVAEAARATEEAAAALIAELEPGVKAPFNAPLNPPSIAPMDPATHRSRHRMGVLPKIEADPELRAFIVARIHTLTFPEIAAQVARAFPPERRVATASVHRWWQKTGQFLPVQSATISSNQLIPPAAGQN